jgi:regulator of sigma E protease
MTEDKNKKLKALAFFGALLFALLHYPWAVEVAVAISAVIIVHELGHFLVAKASGIRVEVFSLGFGAPLVSFEWGGTRYQIAPLPLGGYVKPAGEFEEKEGTQGQHAPDEFLGKPWYVRAAVLLAGPFMNFIAPVVLLFALYATLGRPFFIAPPVVTEVAADSGAAEAGIKKGDQIIKIDGHWANDSNALIAKVDAAARSHPGKKTALVVLRDGKQIDIGVLSRLNSESGRYRLGIGIRPGPAPQRRVIKKVIPSTPAERAGFRMGDTILSVGGILLKQGADFPQLFSSAKEDKDGNVSVELARAGQTLALQVRKAQPVPASIDRKLIGVVGLDFELNSDVMSKDEKKYEKLGVLEAGKIAFFEVAWRVKFMVQGMVELFTGRIKFKESVSGPVAIARMAHEEAKAGFMDLLLFMVNISLILGVMNLLPLPLLDGGTFVFCVIEGIRGKALSAKTQSLLQYVGLTLIIGLVLFSTYNDLGSVFHSILSK